MTFILNIKHFRLLTISKMTTKFMWFLHEYNWDKWHGWWYYCDIFFWNFGTGCQLIWGLNPWLPYENLAWTSASWADVRSLRHVEFPQTVHLCCSVKFMSVLHVDGNYGWGWKTYVHKSQWTACPTLQPYDVVFADVSVVVLVVVVFRQLCYKYLEIFTTVAREFVRHQS
jgi:hypothetical protein